MNDPAQWLDIQAVLDGERNDLLRVLEGVEPPDEPPRACPKCSEPMEWLAYVSDAESWRNLAGRGGYLQICRRCQVWTKLRVVAFG
ncbi:MAG: hypothetical protein AB1725_02675 [Armatimonadota bacterium]